MNKLAEVHQDKGTFDGKTALYFCENFTCQQPNVELVEVDRMLQSH